MPRASYQPRHDPQPEVLRDFDGKIAIQCPKRAVTSQHSRTYIIRLAKFLYHPN